MSAVSAWQAGFSRGVLRAVIADVRQHRPGITVAAAWVYKTGKGQWEFHYAGELHCAGFYWHGSASDAYEARAKGWGAWLAKEGVKGWTV